MRNAVFLDRDGVINANRSDYVKTWDEFVFLPGVFDALQRLAQDKRAIVIISNQSAIGRGLVRGEIVEEIHRRMKEEIRQRDGRIDAVFYCPHRPNEHCDCRKPRPGLLLQAASELDVDLTRSYLVGDAISDIEAALAVGCQPILVLTGRGHEQYDMLKQQVSKNVQVVANLMEAVDLILTSDVRQTASIQHIKESN